MTITAQPTAEDMRELLSQARALRPGTAPWKVDVMENVGENWLICECGTSSMDSRDYIVTTDHVHASEMDSDPATDAGFIVWCRNNVGHILRWVEEEVDACSLRRETVRLEERNAMSRESS